MPIRAHEVDAALPRYHERIRRRGAQPIVYWLVRAILKPALFFYFRVTHQGRHHVPQGPVLLAANHRSFLDPWVIGYCIPRPVYCVAKHELFHKRWQAWLLNALGAFPIRRGESDEEATATALALLARGEVVVIFPEGTRHRTGSLGRAKRGVGRLALESGAPVVPIAVTGTEHARRGWLIKPAKVTIRFGRPLTFPRVEAPSQSLAREVTARIWPCVELQWEWLGGLPPLRKAAVIGAGSMGTAMAVLLARAGLEVQLCCRTAAQAERLAGARVNERHLPGEALQRRIEITTVAEIEPAAVDLVVVAVPCAALPAAIGRIGAQVGPRAAVLVVSKGLVPPLGTTPSAYVAERTHARAVAVLGGPAHAAEAVADGASVVVASHDADLRRQLSEVLARADLDVDTTADVTGAELAACAKNAAALAAAIAAARGANMAGSAAGRVFAEVHALAVARGGEGRTFAGLAGAGDLIATSLAPGSRNRRAGELVGQGVPADQVPRVIGHAAEALGTVPLLRHALEQDGIDAPATDGLCSLLEGRTSLDHWLESVRYGRRERSRRAA